MTYISNNLHDCYLQEKPRAEIARQVAEFEARKGRVETMPMVKRSPDTRVDLVIRADVEDKKSRTKIANSGRRRGYPKWMERENMLELAKRYRLVARDIGRQSGVKPASRAAEYLSGRKTPHPDLANEMERVILQMVAEK